MKTFILIAAVFIGFSAQSQSLKDALFSGKLKTDSGTVIRKGEDLSSKIDTSTKKSADLQKVRVINGNLDSSQAGGVMQNDSTMMNDSASLNNVNAVTPTEVNAPKDNNKIWKEYIDSFSNGLKTEVLPSKKLKEGIYSVLIEYEIGTDGQIAVNKVSSSPESSYLEDQIKERLILTAPQMVPLIGTNGKPRVAAKKQMLTLSK